MATSPNISNVSNFPYHNELWTQLVLWIKNYVYFHVYFVRQPDFFLYLMINLQKTQNPLSHDNISHDFRSFIIDRCLRLLSYLSTPIYVISMISMRYCKLLSIPFDALTGCRCSLALIILITFDRSMFQTRSKALTIIGNSEFARKHLLLLVWCSIFCLATQSTRQMQVGDVPFCIISSLGAKNVVLRSTIILVAISSLCATINLVNELWKWFGSIGPSLTGFQLSMMMMTLFICLCALSMLQCWPEVL